MHRTYSLHELRNAGLLLCLSFCFSGPLLAAISTDGTTGVARSLAGPNYAIPASLGSQAGGNLFHSFSVFNINSGESATFSGPNNVSNIIARVSGGGISTIDGGLNSTIPLANLILVNPSGILFGPNASLDVGGSFYASTANYVRLADGGVFDATTPANSVLTTAPLAAFGFLGPVAPISVQGANLAVAEGKTLSLIGGDIDVTGSLKALGGIVNVASVASAGEAGLASGLDVSGFALLGAISLDAPINVSAGVISGTGTTEQAGSIYIQGGQITTGAATSLTAYTSNLAGGNIAIRATDTLTIQGFVSTDAGGAGHGGSIYLNATSMVLDNAIVYADTYGGGNAGSVIIDASRLNILNGSCVSSDVMGGTGNGGIVSLNAASMILDNAKVYADTYDTGNAGSVTLTADQLDVFNGSWISSDAMRGSAGNGGSVYVDVAGNMTVANGLITTKAQGAGLGGSIFITAANSITLSSGAQIKSDSTADGGAGFVSITTSELNIDGSTISSTASGWGGSGFIDINVDKLNLANAGVIDATTSSTNSQGWGGYININAATSVALGGGAQIKSDSTADSGAGFVSITASELNIVGSTISSTASGWGGGGYIGINVDKLMLANAGSIDATTSGFSRGGDISINAATSVALSRFAKINSDSTGDGDAGSVSITTLQLNIDSEAAVSSMSSGWGNGGWIDISVDKLTLANGGMVDIGAFSTGNGGYISVDAKQSIDVSSGATIYSDSLSAGNGGYISLVSPVVNIDGGNIIASANDSGFGGWIQIEAGKVTLANTGTIDANSYVSGSGGYISLAANELNVDGVTISSNAFGSGDGGHVEISGETVMLSNAGKIDVSSSGSGLGGFISVNAVSSIGLSGGAQISSSSVGAGNAGYISINAGNTFTSENSSVTTEALLSDGGNISLVAKDLIYLNYSDVTATVRSGVGNGGNIFIDPQFVALNNSNITANAFGGNGGNINLIANNFFQSTNSTITASSALGVPGTVALNAQLTDLSGSLANLPMVYLDTTGLIKQRCAAQLEGNISTFVTSGRGGIPHEPGNLMPSASLLANVFGPQAGAGWLQTGAQYASLSGVGCTN